MPCRGTIEKRRVQVVIADSTRIHTQLLANAVKRDHQIQVVGSVSTSHDLLDVVAKCRVDVAVVSSVLDENPSGGFELLREIHHTRASVRGVMLLDSSKRDNVVQAFRAGAKGIFSKSDSPTNLCKCIRCVHEGQIWANHADLTFALDALAAGPPIRAVNAKGMALLSKRELQVVEALAEGLTNREIGQRLGLSFHTIKNHVERIFDKVGASNRMELLFLTATEPARSLRGAGGDFRGDLGGGSTTPDRISLRKRSASSLLPATRVPVEHKLRHHPKMASLEPSV
jgi:DNA-binding NarL/FixJ family response regulator